MSSLNESLQGNSGLVNLGSLSPDSDSLELYEAFIVINPKEHLEIFFPLSHYCSFTLVQGSATIADEGEEITRFYHGVHGRVYQFMEMFEGTLSFYNSGNCISVIQLSVSPIMPSVQFSSQTTHQGFVSKPTDTKQSDTKWISSSVSRMPNNLQHLLAEHLETLGEVSSPSNGGRSRICVHQSDESLIHEMFMSFETNTIFPAMSHSDKNESLTLFRGQFLYEFFDNRGTPVDSLELTGALEENFDSSKPFYIRIFKDVFHAPTKIKNRVLAKETTTGPFLPNQTVTLTISS